MYIALCVDVKKNPQRLVRVHIAPNESYHRNHLKLIQILTSCGYDLIHFMRECFETFTSN